MKRALAGLALVLSLSFTAARAHAQAKPDDLVKQRKAAFTLFGKYFGPLGGMAKDKVPYDAAVVAKNAVLLEALTQMPWDGFQPSTAEVKNTKARPEIYKDKAKFDGFAKDLQAMVAKLVTASKGSDKAAIMTAIGNVGGACKTCHESFERD